MLVRPAEMADADQAIDVVRRSIMELCTLDHRNDPGTLSAWLLNKTADNMRRWIDANTVLVAADHERIAGVAAVRADGHVLLNYVAPEARFKGASRFLIREIEVWASQRGLGWLTLDSTATALRFYQSNGWITVGPPQPGFGVTMRHPMRKDLTAAR
jgi:GNAT superfamily N-acetyltransferase